MCIYSITHMNVKVNIDGQQVELDGTLPRDQAIAKAKAQAQLKSRLIKGTVTGSGIALGAAATEVTLAAAAEAAGAVATAAAEAAIVPVVLAAATVGAVGYGAYRAYKWLND